MASWVLKHSAPGPGVVMVWSWLVDRVAPQGDNEGIAAIVDIGIAEVILLIVTAAVTGVREAAG